MRRTPSVERPFEGDRRDETESAEKPGGVLADPLPQRGDLEVESGNACWAGIRDLSTGSGCGGPHAENADSRALAAPGLALCHDSLELAIREPMEFWQSECAHDRS